MQYLYIMYDETVNLIDFDGTDFKTIRIPTELSGVVLEEILMVVNEEAINGSASAIDGYVLTALFGMNDEEAKQSLKGSTNDIMALTKGILNRATSGTYTDVRFLPDNKDMDLIMMNVDVEDYAVSHRKTYRKYSAGEDILLHLHAEPIDEVGDEEEFIGTGDSVRLTYIAKYGVFC